MKKIVYLIRHSRAMKVNNEYNFESLQTQNEKYPLSIEGEILAKEKLVINELTNLDLIVSSNYCRAIGTAKYLTVNNNKEIVILPNFGERKFGVNNYEELPKDFHEMQYLDNDFKMSNGESINEVKNRTFIELNNLLNKEYKRIAIVSHSKAIECLLRNWCDISINKLKFSSNISNDFNFEFDILF